MIGVKPRYDGLAEWYDEVMRDPGDRGLLARSAYETLADLLGTGRGAALDIGCGTGLAAERVRMLGYEPYGIDLSLDQLGVASRRLQAVQGDAARLPVASRRVPLAYSTFVSSDLDEFDEAVSEAYRVLRPGGRYVSVCVHPCLNGGYSQVSDDGTVVVRPGYASSGYQSAFRVRLDHTKPRRRVASAVGGDHQHLPGGRIRLGPPGGDRAGDPAQPARHQRGEAVDPVGATGPRGGRPMTLERAWTDDSVTKDLAQLRGTSPLTHCLTNLVVTGFTANVLLAVGASPAMVIAAEEVEDFAAVAEGLLVNVGTVTSADTDAMNRAARAARAARTPWVLDPVAVGPLRFRTELVGRLLEHGPSIIRGNASEILALVGSSGGGRGADSTSDSREAIEGARELATRTGAVVAVSGAVDYITDGEEVVGVPGGHVLLTKVTGSGCARSAR